jgi:hypothetical protein
MSFYDLNGNQLTQQNWINYYEPFYYLDEPRNIGQKITRKNKTNIHVERKIENILNDGLTNNDIPLVIAWKIGAIDHINSSQNNIIFRQNFNTTYQFQTQFNRINANHIINYCKVNFNNLLTLNGQNLLGALMGNRRNNSYFGLVYCLTLVYFFSKGYWPIYDKYAYIALYTILNNIQPHNTIHYTQINNWHQYQLYVHNIISIFGQQNISRQIDRSLWVYGHLFLTGKGKKG